jgi:hypothetical protein
MEKYDLCIILSYYELCARSLHKRVKNKIFFVVCEIHVVFYY